VDEEDSLAPILARERAERSIDIAVVRLPHIACFTDFTPLEQHPALGLRFADRPEKLGNPDLIILPGAKNTMSDMAWLWQSGLAEKIKELAQEGTPILGVCGGYQMLGSALHDPLGVEQKGSVDGLGLLPCETVFVQEKLRRRRDALCTAGALSGARLRGYEIHMGRTERLGGAPFCQSADGEEEGTVEGCVFGTYLHGLFDSGELTEKLAAFLARRKGIEIPKVKLETREAWQSRQYDSLADAVRKSLDMAAIRRAMEDYAK
jgi:adenosylcobyric acid synthase